MEKRPPAAPPKRRLSSILKTGNSIRPDETEGIDITTGFGLTGPQLFEPTPLTATVGLPRRVSFFEQPQILDISPAHRSTDEPSESENPDDDLNKTTATNVSMEMSYDEAAGAAAGNFSHIINTTMDKTCAVNVPMDMTHVTTTYPNQYGHVPASTMVDMSLGGATMAKGWAYADVTDEEMNKTYACDVPMEMSHVRPNTAVRTMNATTVNAADMSLCQETAMSGQTRRFNDGQLEKTIAQNVSMDVSRMDFTRMKGSATANATVDMSLGGTSMAKGSNYADDEEEMNRTHAGHVPMEMSRVTHFNANATMRTMNATTVNTTDMSLCQETAMKTQAQTFLNGHQQLGKTIAQNVSMDVSNANFTRMKGSETANATVDMSFGTTAATRGRGYVEIDDEDLSLSRTVRTDIPMEMSTGHPNFRTMNATAANMADMSLCGETAAPPENYTQLTDASKSCAGEMPMELSHTNARTMGFTIASDMSVTTESTAEEGPDAGNRNLNFDPVPAQAQAQRLVHPSEISARPNVLPAKFQPARVAQMANAPNLADNSQYVEFLLRNPLPASQQQQKNANPVVPSSSSGYGQFGSAKTPKRNWNTSQMSYPHHSQWCEAHGPPAPVQIQKIILNSVESQTSPQTNFISTGTSITPKEPQKSLKAFTPHRDFQQQTSTPEGEQLRIQQIREKEEVQVLAPAAPPPRNEEPSFSSGEQEQGQEIQVQLPIEPTASTSGETVQQTVDVDEVKKQNQRRRETYTVQKLPILPQSQIIEINGQETTPTGGAEGILDTSNLSFASTMSSEPEPEIDESRQIQGHMMQGQSKSSGQANKTTNGIYGAPERMPSASALESTTNFGLTREIHPLRPEDQSNSTWRIGAANTTGSQAPMPMASSTMNSSQTHSHVSQVECLTREILPLKNYGNATFRVENNTTTIIQEMSATVPDNVRPPGMTTASFSQFAGNSAAARDLMPPPTPRGRPTTAPPLPFLTTPQHREDSSFAMPPPSSARKNNLDMSVSMSFKDPVQQQHHLSYATWESRLGPKTRHFLTNYTKMRLGERARHWGPMTDELRSKLTRNEFEQFAEDFAHAFPDWFLPSVLSHFEMQEVFAVPLNQYDTHPAIVKITGGPGTPKLRSLEELLSVKWTLPPIE